MNSSPVPVIMTARFSRSSAISPKACAVSWCESKSQTTAPLFRCSVISRIPSCRSIFMFLYLVEYSSNLLMWMTSMALQWHLFLQIGGRPVFGSPQPFQRQAELEIVHHQTLQFPGEQR